MTTVNSVTTGPILTYLLGKALFKGAQIARDNVIELYESYKENKKETEAAIARGDLVEVYNPYEDYFRCGLGSRYVRKEEITEQKGNLVLVNGQWLYKLSPDVNEKTPDPANRNMAYRSENRLMQR